MKKFKKLIPAFCAMLVSAAMLGTSTYAWFSVNKEVTATDMSVTAVADTQYFVILSDVTSGFTSETGVNKTASITKVAAGGIGDQAKAYPTAYATADLTLAGSADVKVQAGNWYTAGVDAEKEEAGNGANSKYSTLEVLGNDENGTTVKTKTNYFVGYRFYVGLADDTASCTQVLSFESVETANSVVKIAGITVKYAGNGVTSATEEYVSFVATGATKKTTSAYEFVAKDSKNSGTNTAKYVEVVVYVYIDGTNTKIMSENLKTANQTNLTGSIGVKVTAENKAA